MLPNQVVKQSDHLKKVCVLVVDNDQRIIAIMLNVMKYLGFSNVISARDGFAAVEMMREQKVDLVITDWELQQLDGDYGLKLPPNPVVCSDMWSPVPPKDGACFVRYIRGSKYSPNPYIPVIMMTGLGLRHSIEYARDAGVNEIVIKPVSIESLCDRIIKIIDKPRPFVTSEHYKGPCRRINPQAEHQPERRQHDIRLFRHAG